MRINEAFLRRMLINLRGLGFRETVADWAWETGSADCGLPKAILLRNSLPLHR